MSALANYWCKRWEAGVLCDIVINCKDDNDALREVKCHSFVLISSGKIFEVLNEELESFIVTTTNSSVTMSVSTDESLGVRVIQSDCISYLEWKVLLNLLYYGSLREDKIEEHLRGAASQALLQVINKLQLENVQQSANNSRENLKERVDDVPKARNAEPEENIQHEIKVEVPCEQNSSSMQRIVIQETHLEIIDKNYMPDDCLNMGSVEGVFSKCVFCWKNEQPCYSSNEIECFLCLEYVDRLELDQHWRRQHTDYELPGYFTCHGPTFDDKLKANPVVGKALQNVLDGKVYIKYSCQLCELRFSSYAKFRQHLVLKHHVTDVNSVYRCKQCFLCFTNQSSRIDHEHFCTNQGLPVCKHCDLKFSSPATLKRHVTSSHSNQKDMETDTRQYPNSTQRAVFRAYTDHNLTEEESEQEDLEAKPEDNGKKTKILPSNKFREILESHTDPEEAALPTEQQIEHTEPAGAGDEHTSEASPSKARSTLSTGLKRTKATSEAQEGGRLDQNSICLYCWKKRTICSEARTLKCLVCSTVVESSKLDSHTLATHKHLPFGVYSCQGKSNVVLPENSGLLAVKAEGDDDYRCFLCMNNGVDYVAPDPKSIRTHLVAQHSVRSGEESLSNITRCRYCFDFYSSVNLCRDHGYFCEHKKGDIFLPNCLECDTRFSSPNSYLLHMKSAHNAGRKTNLDAFAEDMNLDQKQNSMPFSFTNTSGEPNAEFDRTDRRSLCLNCYKFNTACKEDQLLKCFVCFETVNSAELDSHALTRHPHCNSGIYTCLGIHNCRLKNPKALFGMVGYKVSNENKDEEDIYQCGLCEFNTANVQHFKDHLGERHQVKVSKSNFVPRCRYCHVFFSANSMQEDHEYFCLGADLPFCVECTMKFASPNAWRRHNNEVHNNKYGPKKFFSNAQNYKSLHCDECGVSFKNKPAMKYHMKTRHKPVDTTESQEKYKCDYCGATFTRLSTLNDHINFRHTKVKEYKCRKCDRSFLRKTEQTRHEAMHGKSMAIKCSMCGFQGFTKFEMKRHFFKDHQIGQFKCTCCRAKFTDYEKYEEHKFLRLCPRYNNPRYLKVSKGTRNPHSAPSSEFSTEEDSNMEISTGAEEVQDQSEARGDDEEQLCTWVTDSGQVYQARVQRSVVTGGEGGQERLQLVQLPNGEMQLVQVQEEREDLEVVDSIPQAVKEIESEVPIPQESPLPEPRNENVGIQVLQLEDGRIEVRHTGEVTIPTEIHTSADTMGSIESSQDTVSDITNAIDTGDGCDVTKTDQLDLAETMVKEEHSEETVVVETEVVASEYMETSNNSLLSQDLPENNASSDTTVESSNSRVITTKEQVLQMSLEAFQEAYGKEVSVSVEESDGADGKCYVVYV